MAVAELESLGISDRPMISVSYNHDLLRIGGLIVPWWLQIVWLLSFFSLVTGYAVWSSRYAWSGGIKIYSRKIEPFNYWMTWFFYVGISVFLGSVLI